MSYSPRDRLSPYFYREGENHILSPNERLLLKRIWQQNGLSRSELSSQVDLTQQSVHRIIDQLTDRGILRFGAPKPGAGRGQPSPTLYLNEQYACCCGISLNTDIVGICLMDMAGNLRGESHFKLHGQSRDTVLTQIEQQLIHHCQQQGYEPHQLLGIGFAIAGYNIEGTKFNAPLPLHEWSLIELGPLLAERFQHPVWVENGSNTAAIAENMLGIGRYIRHFAYLSFNYGLGGGLISAGELLAGGYGNAGEFSGIYNADEMERRPTLKSLLDRLQQHAVDVPDIDYLHRHFDPQWPGVNSWLDEVKPAYNQLINAITAIFNPQAIVFGGQIPAALADMLIARTAFYGRPRYGVSAPRAKLLYSGVNGDASAIGAAMLPLKTEFY